ncbi:hypothetical protein N9S35_00285 [Candidatus Pelagibacter bacterium]|nr:glycosyltransferase N-terminal domain-containing protein [Candidatus Pelagibacter bacterium]MDA9619021.1 hypothetical protein [Candidatus Pelagibacter bacterium]
MIHVYRIITTILYPFLFVFLYYRKLTKKEHPKRFKEKILISHFNVKKKGRSKLIWFHAASIGEFKSIIPIIEELNIRNKGIVFLITTTTLSSGNLAKLELSKFNNVEHRFFPFDINFLVDKFLFLWKPDKIFLVDSEIWPNLILKAKHYGIPIALINARLTSKSIKNWMFFYKSAKNIFGIFNLFLCSNIETKKFLEKLNVKKVYYKGNIKLISKINRTKIKSINENFLSKKKFWFAASTHGEEDEFCLKTHLEIKEKYNDIITIIAPRHIERAKKIKTISEKHKLEVQILNKGERIKEKKDIIIINYFGALDNFFKYAKSVFMGKSIIRKLKNVSGQNPIDAAKFNCKIYHGPYVYNFKEIYKILENKNISKKIDNYMDLSKHLIIDLKNSNKKKLKNKNLINELGEKTLSDTMVIINYFLNDKIN